MTELASRSLFQSPAPPRWSENRTDVDLHVHTVASACGFTALQRILDLARAAGRSVVAVTDHDSAEGAVAVRDLARNSGDAVLVLVGMELTTADYGHVVVIGEGVEEDWGWRAGSPLPRRFPEEWAVIQAHPFRGHVRRTVDGLQVDELPDLPERVDAVELWNGNDLIKKSPELREEFNTLSNDYVARNRKVAVASSDGHRPLWTHSFFTRFARPIASVQDAVDQLRSGQVTPQAADATHVQWCIERWRVREVVEWHEAGKDWRALAAEAGRELEEAERSIAQFLAVRSLLTRGAPLRSMADDLGLPPHVVADYVDVVAEEAHTAALRVRRTAAAAAS